MRQTQIRLTRDSGSIIKMPTATPTIPSTEAAIVAQFAEEHRGQYLYDRSRGSWLAFGPHAWHPDRDGAVVRALQTWLTTEITAAVSSGDSDRMKLLPRCLRAGTIRQLVDLAGYQEPLVTSGEHFDGNPLLVGATNGVIDLATGLLRPGTPDDMITRSLGTAFDRAADCPRWLRFLGEVLPDAATVNFLWRAVAYTLSGLTREHVMFLLAGVTRGGKGVICRTLLAMFKELGTTVDFASLTSHRHRRGNEATPDLAVLPGIRFATASEVNDGRRFDEARIKSLTGGDAITCRPLYGRPLVFSPQFRLWLAVNDLPSASEDPAFWTRTRVIPFRTSFLGREDRTLEDALLDELPGILNWAVEGFAAYLATGLTPTDDMVRTADAWRDDCDVLAPFIASLEAAVCTASVPVPDLYDKYESWAAAERLGPHEKLKRVVFGKKIARKFATRRSNGKTFANLTPVQECR